MRTDPFEVRRRPKYHPARIGFTLYGRFRELICAHRFNSSALPLKEPENLLQPEEGVQPDDTAVTPAQMRHLAAGLASTEDMHRSAIVEVGCYRGVTTRFLAERSARRVFAVDPFLGYGGCEEDMTAFRKRIDGLANVTLLRKTSGEAARSWTAGQVSFIFIDAVHDYVNVAHDIEVWAAKLAPGILALHDTDDPRFSGARRAAFEAAGGNGRFRLFGHTDNLTMLRKTQH